MSTDNGTRQLCFPIRDEIPLAQTLILSDLDVVGVGSLRRQQIEKLCLSKKIILETHEDQIPRSVLDIYHLELLQTLQWLRPLEVVAASKVDYLELQKKLFIQIFPKTAQALGVTMAKMRDLYLQEMEWNSWLLQDHWRYFVGFLRQKFSSHQPLLELAHWEWVLAWIEIQPFSFSRENEGLHLNPSLQVVSLSVANPALGRDKGLYAFVYCEKKATVVERNLDAYDAQLLDLLQEDRKFSSAQLLAQAALSEELSPQLSSTEWEKRFLSLQQDGIIEE